MNIKTEPEELRFDGRELYIYFPNGMGRAKMSWPTIEKSLKDGGDRQKLEQRNEDAGNGWEA